MTITCHQRRAFSLMELMIAIVILGIGMVMVATIFPVGIDIARETIEQNMAVAAGDAAFATLKLKVPAFANERTLDPAPLGVNSLRVLVPSAGGRNMYGDFIIDEFLSDISDEEYEAIDGLYLSANPNPPVPAWSSSPWETLWSDIGLSPSQSLDQFFGMNARVFTEWTGWDSELLGTPTAGMLQVLPVASQNLPARWDNLVGALIHQMPVITHPTFGATGTGARSHLPRIHLVDQVYPPVDPLALEFNQPPAVTGIHDALLTPELLRGIADRRYSWVAFHRRTIPQAEVRDLLVTIVITRRADLTSRFPRQMGMQGGPPYSIGFNLSNPGHIEALRTPQPDTSSEWLFPRPWLVVLNEVDKTGKVTCTQQVARLLPRGAQFIVAHRTAALRTPPPPDPPGQVTVYNAGETIEVLKSNYEQAITDPHDNPTATLSITPPNALKDSNDPDGIIDDAVVDVPVWVIPPAYDAGRFQTRAPVVGVTTRRLSVQ